MHAFLNKIVEFAIILYESVEKEKLTMQNVKWRDKNFFHILRHYTNLILLLSLRIK